MLIARGLVVNSGFLVVKRFEALYRAFASEPGFTSPIYALPLFGTSPDRLAVKYRGLDRNAIGPNGNGSLAAIRMLEINGEDLYGTDEFLATHRDAQDVLGWADQETPDTYEIVWTRIAGHEAEPPSGFESLGFEPSYFLSDHFSAICDCMCFPRWHGTDEEGTAFRAFFERLNPNGLFDEARVASEFLAHYLSFDWTERGHYEIAEVWAR
jgi:hypothetical protein